MNVRPGTYSNLRSSFLGFFQKHDHLKVESSSLIPHNDPSLLFVNSGMVQFKDVFLGLESPKHSSAVTVQKCIRAGGKHNDLDNVGYTKRHHTFFEMLGNFSFNGYFKEKAIVYAWDFLTNELKIDKNRLYITIYHNDDESYGIWERVLGKGNADRIIRISTNDNFWMMGDSGPCGPCSEIYYDNGAHISGGLPGSSTQDGDRYVEIWNLVFMQFQKNGDSLTQLTQKAIDTGMGLERIASVMEGVSDNYETSLFKSIIDFISSKYPSKVGESIYQYVPYRIVSDHIRSMCFLLSDGILPSNEGRGYVLRRIMRRAMRYLHQIDPKNANMHTIAGALINNMGYDYPDLEKSLKTIEESIRHEENGFKETLDRGLAMLEEEISKNPSNDVLSGEVAFKLYDTYGFPIDLTDDIVKQKGISIDMNTFENLLQKQKSLSKAKWKGSGEKKDQQIWFDLVKKIGQNRFIGYEKEESESGLVAIIDENGVELDSVMIDKNWSNNKLFFVFEETPFYPEGGGQVGDSGFLEIENIFIEVLGTYKFADSIIASEIKIPDNLSNTLKIKKGDIFRLKISSRQNAACHHTATHLLHSELRNMLGEHVAQKGSRVNGESLRFDFNFNRPLTDQEISKIENNINSLIRNCLLVTISFCQKNEAIKKGAMAFFNEKYGDEVRVVEVGSPGIECKSIELCGGTHIKNTGEIGLFKIISEESVGSGIRRIEALAGESAWRYVAKLNNLASKIGEELKVSIKKDIIEYNPEKNYFTYEAILKIKEALKLSQKENERLSILLCANNAKKDDNNTYIIEADDSTPMDIVRKAMIEILNKDSRAKILANSKSLQSVLIGVDAINKDEFLAKFLIDQAKEKNIRPGKIEIFYKK